MITTIMRNVHHWDGANELPPGKYSIHFCTFCGYVVLISSVSYCTLTPIPFVHLILHITSYKFSMLHTTLNNKFYFFAIGVTGNAICMSVHFQKCNNSKKYVLFGYTCCKSQTMSKSTILFMLKFFGNQQKSKKIEEKTKS